MKRSCKTVLILSVFALTVVNTLATNWHFSGPNIALFKNTSQVPCHHNCYPASLAVDGYVNNHFGGGSCSQTDAFRYDNANIGVAQWMVDLGDSFNITGIIIYSSKEHKNDLKGFQVFGFGNATGNNKWLLLYDDTSNEQYTQDIIKIGVKYDRPLSTVAINVLKPKVSSIKLTLCEVEIYAEVCEKIQIQNGVMKPSKQLFKVGDVATIDCDRESGYQENNSSITCSKTADGFAWNAQPECSLITCIIPKSPENGYYVSTFEHGQSKIVPFGKSIKMMCHKGYEVINDSKRTCQKDGNWDGYQSSCRKKQCQFPGHIEYGEYRFANKTLYTSGSSDYNTTIYITCRKGYLLKGYNKRLCDDNKIWTGSSSCKIIECESLDIPENALRLEKVANGTSTHYTGGQLKYLDKVHVFCKTGYIYNASVAVLECQANELWNGKIGYCYLVTCKKLEKIKGGSYNYSNNTLANGYPYNTIATTACEEPFHLLNPNNSSRKCMRNGEWDNNAVACILRTEEDGLKNTNTPLIGGVAAAIVVISSVIAVVVFLLYRRKMRNDNQTGKPKSYTHIWKRDNNDRHISNSQDDLYSEIQDTAVITIPESTSESNLPSREKMYVNLMEKKKEKNTLENSNQRSRQLQSDDYYSFTNAANVPKTAILVKELSDLILTGSDAKQKFEKEFKELPQGMVQPYKEAMKKKNIIKNRYRNLYAYDETRVVLKADKASNSDYINACYVHGFKRFKQYIASQGPTKEILLDFWRMIWQEESSKIVMLTNLMEDGKEKCEQYWPEEGTSHVFGSIIVRTEKIDSFSQFVKRTFQVKKENSKRNPRTVTQYHFTAWPDKGVPKYASTLVQFTHKVKNDSDAKNGPIIVHCSAGVGRTGTFIALDYLTEQGKTMGFVDVLGTITKFRSQRVCLVQTLDQYIFVHHALVESLMLPTSALPAYKFPDVYQELLQMDTKMRKTKLNLEFETLNKVSPVADESDYVSSKLVRNRRKNRYSNVLPVEEFMPSLMSSLSDNENRYINAVFLPSYKEKKAFIITQTPLDNTREDFWDLIWQHDVHTIVMMNNLKETVDSERYWPQNDELVTFGNIEVSTEGVEKKNHHHLVSLSARKHKVTRKIKQIRCGGWSYNHRLPDSPEVILTLLEIVKIWQRQSGHNTIVVHCMNGVDKSGLFCVISAVIERLQIEQDVAISQVIEEMRNAREQIIPTVEQYKFCHDTILAFIHQFDTYSNFAE